MAPRRYPDLEEQMKAVLREAYGSTDVLELRDVRRIFRDETVELRLRRGAHSIHPNERVTAFCHAAYNRPRCSFDIAGCQRFATPQFCLSSSVLRQ